MADFVIEFFDDSNLEWERKWKLFNRANTLEQAREIAAKAFLKTSYLAIRIRESMGRYD
tara:strand:- start:6701 stop:6877 length:177 start_codon:yes stop_codon:yes gene_type:complete